MDADLKSKPEIVHSTDHYDSWLLALEPAFARDLKQKLTVMAGEPGDFLRATFYRWSERLPGVCLETISAPVVRAVGDVHVGNPKAADDRNDDLSALLLDDRRGPDPQTSVEKIDHHQWALRPLSPDRVGIDFGDVDKVSGVLATRLLRLMGAEVAHVHLLSHNPAPLMSYLTDREPGWLTRAAVAMKEDTETDSEGWRTYREAMDKKPAGGHG